ncbi:MAG: 50S ribosomal protein L21 [Chitinophagales bacterium]|nr:50S ribosomal protein L21 [Chitinophagales bacterium]MDW8427494.1 50S ribosomal protein L21 [Chitinophagales bacterium]
MYAIVEVAGTQLKAEVGRQYVVNRLRGNPGDPIKIDRVLLTVRDGQVSSTPAEVSATILEHLKGNKLIVFKKKRRKGYKVKRGHRQLLTKIQFNSVK